MQFHLEAEELNVLLEAVQQEPGAARELLDRLLERDLRFAFDELEDLAEALDFHAQRLRASFAASRLPEDKNATERKIRVLNRALDRVKECLAMV